ncbi:PVC-type heme-binding CxxCH protein [Planctomicrobium sp. SH661]|uniref:PVC-type heme-binding CxxCH protein n=1 Tax=Planctomicrobium sp. SH661 TaxID=3448124 RepID=UPI003F5CB03E
MARFRNQFALLIFQLAVELLVIAGALPHVKAEEKPLAEELTHLPAVEPDRALETFHFEKGFSLELVAAEPLVSDPVDACFDENGRMYVAEFHAYPYAAEKEKIIPAGTKRAESGIIRMLEDTDGDGKVDRSSIFADGLDWPVSVAPYRGGIFVIDPPDLYYLKDTDGDGKADVRETVFTDLGRNNIQGIANNLKWGLDNRIYVASSSNGGAIRHRDEKETFSARGDWSFDPKSESVRRETGGIQFGHSMDDWGDRFLCSNSVHAMHVVWKDKYLSRNPFVTVTSPTRSIAKEGGAAPVFRRSPLEPWRVVRTKRRNADPAFKWLPDTERVAGGFFTSAAGITIYRGAAYPEEFQGNLFVSDVGSNLIHRKTLTPNRATFLAVRADENTELVASTDTWFRPVNYVNAPDGSLYVLDMYRDTIEHPISIPPDIRALLNLENGNDRGRIYRLVSPDMKRFSVKRLGDASIAELVEELAAPNSWNRETAQRLLWERQDPASIPLVEQLLQTTPVALGRLHALYTLQGLGALTPQHVLFALKDANPGVRRHAIELSEPFLSENPELAEVVLSYLTDDDDFRVRFQATLALSWMNDKQMLQGLFDVAKKGENDSDLQSAFLLSIADQGARFSELLIQDDELRQRPGSQALLEKIAEIVGSRPERPAQAAMLKTIADARTPDDWRGPLLRQLGQGLTRSGSSFQRLTEELPANSPEHIEVVKLFENASETALDESGSAQSRKAALQLLAIAPWSVSQTAFRSLLEPQVTQEAQLDALDALGDVQDPLAAELLVASWRSLTPASRSAATKVFLSKLNWTERLLKALEEGTIKARDLDRTLFPNLLKHPNSNVRERSAKVLVNEANPDRQLVLEQYQPALNLSGDRQRGHQVYLKNCAMCHRLGNEGFQVGPDLVSVQNKIPADLLTAILDPNRESQLNFLSFTIATQSGQVHSGIIAAETAGSVTLRRAEAKEDVILRSQIDELISSGQSLMPEGLEKQLSQQDVADVIEFIRTLSSAENKQTPQ